MFGLLFVGRFLFIESISCWDFLCIHDSVLVGFMFLGIYVSSKLSNFYSLMTLYISLVSTEVSPFFIYNFIYLIFFLFSDLFSWSFVNFFYCFKELTFSFVNFSIIFLFSLSFIFTQILHFLPSPYFGCSFLLFF